MQKDISFLKIASKILKVFSWLILILGLFSGISILLKIIPEYPRFFGLILIFMYGFIFFIFLVFIKAIELLIKVTEELRR